jgi:hypothetical protein
MKGSKKANKQVETFLFYVRRVYSTLCQEHTNLKEEKERKPMVFWPAKALAMAEIHSSVAVPRAGSVFPYNKAL